MRRSIGSLTLFAMLGSPLALASAQLQDLAAITGAAEAAATSRGKGIRAKAEALDLRLRLTACDQPLDASLPAAAKGARISVRVSCPGPAPWSLLVPVQVETDAAVVVAVRPLVPGTLLTADDLARVERRIPGFPDCCSSEVAALVGQRVRRPVAADTPVPLDSLEAAPLVRRGEMVTVIAGSPGFEVRSTGIAMADARQGDALRVRHATSLRVIQARADSRGVVRADR